MKKFTHYFILLCMMMTAGLVWSCDDDDDEKGPSYIVTLVNDSIVSPTQATFEIETSGITEIAYTYAKADSVAAGAELPAGDLIFAAAEAVTTVDGGTTTITIKGLEGKTSYVAYFAMKTAEGFLVDKQEFTTGDYTQVITILEASRFCIKYYVNVPDTTWYRYACSTRDNYISMKEQFGTTDFDYLQYNGYGLFAQGPQLFVAEDGGEWYTEPETDWSEAWTYYYTIKPGTAMLVMIGACDAEGNVQATFDNAGGDDDDWLLWAPQTRTNINLGDYTETCTDEGLTFNGVYARQYLWTEAPIASADTVAIEVNKLTERSAVFTLTPPDNILSYQVMLLDQSAYDMLIHFVGEDGLAAYVASYGEPCTGGMEYDMTGMLELGVSYHLMIAGIFDEMGETQSFTDYAFAAIESNKPVSEVVITPLDDMTTHDHVYFNIKAPNKDCAGIRYLCNYTKEWVSMLNSGYTEEDMLGYYGNDIFDETELNAINSDEGFVIDFTSQEETETMLAIISYNVDEKASEVYTAKVTSKSIPAKDPVDSDLFTDLLGDWTCHYIDNSLTDSIKSCNVVFTTNPDDSPATFADWKSLDSYATVQKMLDASDEELEALFNEYKEVAAHYENKYKGQNQILACGFDMLDKWGYGSADYQSPWALFTSSYYSAYDNAQLFYDFGPKMFFEVKADGSLVLCSDIHNLAPMSNYSSYPYYLIGYNKATGYLESCEFPVEVSEDGNTLTVKPVEFEGTLYYPSTAMSYSAGYLYANNRTNHEMTFTRGATASEAQMVAGNAPTGRPAGTGIKMLNSQNMKRTYLPLVAKKKMEYKKATLELHDVLKNLSKQVKK